MPPFQPGWKVRTAMWIMRTELRSLSLLRSRGTSTQAPGLPSIQSPCCHFQLSPLCTTSCICTAGASAGSMKRAVMRLKADQSFAFSPGP